MICCCISHDRRDSAPQGSCDFQIDDTPVIPTSVPEQYLNQDTLVRTYTDTHILDNHQTVVRTFILESTPFCRNHDYRRDSSRPFKNGFSQLEQH